MDLSKKIVNPKHKFSQKIRFKSTFDGPSNLIKNEVKKLELKLTIVTNDIDCCKIMQHVYQTQMCDMYAGYIALLINLLQS